jgi:hypothetical protein
MTLPAFSLDQSFLRKLRSQLTVRPIFFAARAPSSDACAAASEDFVPVEVGGIDLGNGAVGAVVGDSGRALGGAAFEVVNADAVAAAQDVCGIDAEPAQALDAGLGDVVLRQARDEGSLLAEEGQRDSDVGFAAAEGHFQ